MRRGPGACLESGWRRGRRADLRLGSVEVELLGPLQVAVDGAEVALTAAKVRMLLAFLVIHRGQVVSVERIIDALWDAAARAGRGPVS